MDRSKGVTPEEASLHFEKPHDYGIMERASVTARRRITDDYRNPQHIVSVEGLW